MNRRSIIVIAFVLGCVSILDAAQPSTEFKIWVRFSKSGENRGMDSQNALLFINEQAAKLEVRHKTHPLSVKIADIQKVIFEVSHHMRGGLGLALLGATAPATWEAYTGGVYDFWCLVMYNNSDGQVVPYLMELRKGEAGRILNRMRSLLGDRVELAEFPEKEADIEKDSLKDIGSKQDMDVDEVNHPIPEIRPDKALLVVVSPPFPTGGRREPNIFQQKLHANDQVVAINKMGTYSFCYLDPGEYRLVSQATNATGFSMKLEAGKDYYFFQNTYLNISFLVTVKTSLSRQTKELALYEVNGANLSVWKKKK